MTGPRTARVVEGDDLASLLRRLEVEVGNPVLVVVGGAAGLDDRIGDAVRSLFADHLEPVLRQLRAVVIDGGTRSGVMRAVGSAISDRGHHVCLLGVAAEGTVQLPGQPGESELAEIEPNHDLILLVPGQRWGDESPWIDRIGTALAQGRPSATLVVNGGNITYADVEYSLRAARPVVVLHGSGRAADDIAEAVSGRTATDRAVRLALSDLVRSVPLTQPGEVAAVIQTLLSRDLN